MSSCLAFKKSVGLKLLDISIEYVFGKSANWMLSKLLSANDDS